MRRFSTGAERIRRGRSSPCPEVALERHGSTDCRPELGVAAIACVGGATPKITFFSRKKHNLTALSTTQSAGDRGSALTDWRDTAEFVTLVEPTAYPAAHIGGGEGPGDMTIEDKLWPT